MFMCCFRMLVYLLGILFKISDEQVPCPLFGVSHKPNDHMSWKVEGSFYNS